MTSVKKLFALISSIILASSSITVHAEEPAQPVKVKVGYYENEVFQEGAKDGLIKKGYAYEYYRKLSEYTGWEYEYIYGDFIDLYDKLEKGEIDLLAGLSKTPERTKKISFEDIPMGTTQYYLLKKENAHDITQNPASLNGKTIGVQNSGMITMLKNWMSEKNVKPEIVIFNNSEDMLDAFDNRKVDTILVEGAGTYGRKDSMAFLLVGQSQYYLCVAKNKPQLLSQLNEAHQTIVSEDPNFFGNLHTKYFPSSVSNLAFTDAELAFISTHNKISIGYLKNYLPYCDTDKNGELTGFLKDIVPAMLSNLNLTDEIHVEYKEYDNFTGLTESLISGEIDAAFPVGGGLYFSEEAGFYQSHTVINSAIGLVFKDDFSKAHTSRFAVNRNNSMQYYFIKTNFPEAEIVYCDSIAACLDAINSDKADFTTVNGTRINSILKNTKYRNLKYTFLTQSDERCFGVKIGNEVLLHLINRGIGTLNEQLIMNQAYPYSEQLFKYTAWDYIRNILYVLIPLIFIIGTGYIIITSRSRKELKILNKKLQKALENKERYIADMIRYASSEEDADKILNQIVTYIGQNTTSDRVYVFEQNKQGLFNNTYEWCREGITQEIDNLQNVPYEGVIDIWFNEFKKNGCVQISNLEEYKSVSQPIYDILKPQNIQTLTAVPITINGKPIGFVGVDNPPVERINAVAEFLKFVEFIFSMMIRLRNNLTQMEENAVHDQLTGCKNRKALVWAYQNDFNHEQPLSVIAIDLNGLKRINDNQGHEAGDKFIRRSAEILCDVFQKENVYRMGGDEFTVVIKNKTREETDKLLDAYTSQAGSTASIGFAFAEKADIDFAELHKQADFAMYQAKDKFYEDKRDQRRV